MAQPDADRGSGPRSGKQLSIARLIRDAALSAYGVAAVTDRRWRDRLAGRLGRRVPGVHVEEQGGLKVELHIELAQGVPAPAVAANVEESVRYIVQRELGRLIDDLRLVVDGRPTGPESGDTSRRPVG
ncbi:hypothetical protein BH23CHL7_BH23CHL7_22620 [soil metagenome]